MNFASSKYLRAGEEIFRTELKKIFFDNSNSWKPKTKSNYSDDAFGCVGLVAGADSKLCSIIAKQIRRCFKVSWSQLSVDQWRIFKTVQPNSWSYLQDVISSNLNDAVTGIVFSKDNHNDSLKERFSRGLIFMICGSGNSISEKYGKNSPLVSVINNLIAGDIRESVTQLLAAMTEHGNTKEVLCCFEQINDEIIHQLHTIDQLEENGSILSMGSSAAYRQTLCNLKTRLDLIEYEFRNKKSSYGQEEKDGSI